MGTANRYNEHRPHQSRQGRTPSEIYERRSPARDKPLDVRRVPEVRKRGIQYTEPIAEKVPRLKLVVSYSEGRKHLPIIELERAA